MTDDRKQDLADLLHRAIMFGKKLPNAVQRDAWIDSVLQGHPDPVDVFEAAQTPTAHEVTTDEREALAGLFDDHWMTLLGRCSCGWVHPQFGSRSRDPLYVRQHLADAVVAAGFRRTVQGEPANVTHPEKTYIPGGAMSVSGQSEPTDAQVLAALNAMIGRNPGEHLRDYADSSVSNMRAALRAAAEAM